MFCASISLTCVAGERLKKVAVRDMHSLLAMEKSSQNQVRCARGRQSKPYRFTFT